jgi:hypothetical protein
LGHEGRGRRLRVPVLRVTASVFLERVGLAGGGIPVFPVAPDASSRFFLKLQKEEVGRRDPTIVPIRRLAGESSNVSPFIDGVPFRTKTPGALPARDIPK